MCRPCGLAESTDPTSRGRRAAGRAPLRKPWFLVFLCFLIAMYAWGLGFYGMAVYLAALRSAHPDWSTGAISAATTFYYLIGATLLWFVGSAFRRCGLRITVLAGLTCMALGASTLPFLAAYWQLFAAFTVMAIGWASMSTTGIATILASRFDSRRGMALSLALNGASFAGVAVSPVMLLLIREAGFATALPLLILGMAVPLVPLVWFGLAPDDDNTDDRDRAAAIARPIPRLSILRSAAFWTVAGPFALVLMAQVGFLTHQIALLGPRIGAAEAALAVALTTSAAVAGRLSLGLVIDRLDKRRASAACFVLQVAALGILLAVDAPVALYGACILFGLNVGNIITLPALIVQEEFPAEAFALVVGMVTAVTQFAYAFGPGLVGLVRDLADSYGPALLSCMVLNCMAAMAVLLRTRARNRVT